mgnify:CR=1 FL=1
MGRFEFLSGLITTLHSKKLLPITSDYRIAVIMMILLCLLNFSEGLSDLFSILMTLLPNLSLPF